MSEQILFTLYAIPGDEIIEENGARKTTLTFYAPNIRQARAMGSLKFLEQYPDADDEKFEIYVCETIKTTVHGAVDVWNETVLDEYDWDAEEKIMFRMEGTSEPVDFEKLSQTMKVAVLVKYMTTDITANMLPAALELTQDEANTFPGHIVEAITRTQSVASMYPERIMEAIKYVVEKCPTTKKWPEIKAQLTNWKNSLEDKPRAAPQDNGKAPGSGDPDRFALIIAFLVMGINPAKAGAKDVSNAKHIKDSRDAAWVAWHTTLVGIPGIFDLPESELYQLTLEGMKDLSLIKNNEARLAYVHKHFAGHELLPDYVPEVISIESEADTAEQEQEQEQEQETVTERQGPFYYRTPAGEVSRANKLAKLEAVIAQGCEEITREQYNELKNQPSRDDVSRQLAAQRGDYVEGISDPNDPRWVKTGEVKSLGNGIYSFNEMVNEPPKNPSQEVTPEVSEPSDDFRSVGARLEKDMDSKDSEARDNLTIWRSVMRTDPRFTKQLSGTGFEGTSINPEYMIMRATEIFGPIGNHWGYEILEDRMIPGAPFSEAIYDDKKFIGNRMLRDGDGTLLFEQNHSIKIRLWYRAKNGEGEVFVYGATPYMYKTKHGIKCDGEAQKKSLTDAIKKGLSLLGFSADVWLGLYDLPEYIAENSIEFDIKNASDKAEDVTRLRKELDEKFKLNTESMRSAVTPNEVSGIASSLTRVMGVHLKAAREKADHDYAKYLEGRLHRLEEIKVECLQKLKGDAA